jgi:large subunit ribosomal protein L21
VKARLAVIWAAIVAAGVTAIGVITGRRRRRRAERQKAREARRTKKTQRRAQGGGAKRATAAASRASTASASGATSTSTATPGARPAPAEDRPPSSSGTDASSAADGFDGDDLRAIKGLGAVAAEKLRGAGVTTYEQIAAWTPDEAREVALRLELQPGRIATDDWVGQARALIDARAGGDATS